MGNFPEKRRCYFEATFAALLGTYQSSSGLWAVLLGATCQETDQWDFVTCLQHCEWLRSGPGESCHLSKLEFHHPSQSLRKLQFQVIPHYGLWETLSQCGPSPDPPLLYPSCLVLGAQYLECSSLTPFSHHQTTVYLQCGINSFWPCLTLGVLFTSPGGKICSQEMTMSKLFPECWIPDIGKPRRRCVFGGGWEREVVKFHRSSDIL